MADVACIMPGACTADECCAPCMDDPGWQTNLDGVILGCTSFPPHSSDEFTSWSGTDYVGCEEGLHSMYSWSNVGTDSAGNPATAYEACAVSCPASDTPRRCTPPGSRRTCADPNANGTANPFTCPSDQPFLVHPADSVACAADPCTVDECCATTTKWCIDDSGWSFTNDVGSVYDCDSFVPRVGVATCEEAWANGTDSSKNSALAYDACLVSCPATVTARSCEACPHGTFASCGTCTSSGCSDHPTWTVGGVDATRITMESSFSWLLPTTCGY